MKRFAGKIGIVTGSDRGIGRAIAEAFAAEGARTVITSDDTVSVEAAVAEFRRKGAEVLGCPADLRDRPAVDRMVEAVVAEWGRIDILVNNAAVFPRRTPFLEQSYEQWNDVLQVNVMGAFHITQAVARSMVRLGVSGRVVNISSLNSTHYRAGALGITQYGASKAALESMTRGWAAELAPSNIVVNGVAPGFVRSGMSTTDSLDSEDFRREYLQKGRIPLGRVGSPADCARLVLFLASEECAGMAGETIHQDGGTNFIF